MKRVTLIALVLVAASLVLVGAAMANGGPHGDYTATTDACAGCHRAHTAGTTRLLVGTSNSVSEFCLLCHGYGVSGADTDVAHGLYANRNTNYDPSFGAGQEVTASTYISTLLGGGFEYYRVHGALSTTVTSRHNVNVSGWGTAATAAPGALETGVDGALGFTFECSDCHDPHGNDNYRILNTSTLTSTTTVTDVQTTKDYTNEDYGAGISRFCAQCHPAYHATAVGSGGTSGSGGGSKFAHRIDMVWNNDPGDVNWDSWTKNPDIQGYWDGSYTYTLPLYDSNLAEDGVAGTDNFLNCLTCHLAHGSSASMTGFADPDDASALAFTWRDSSDSTGDSFLLRLPNRGVCQVCHQKDPVPTQP